MVKHAFTVVRKDDVVKLEELNRHPSVVKAFEIPNSFIFFELYNRNEDANLAEQRVELLKPLYEKASLDPLNMKVVTGYLFAINTYLYSFLSVKKTIPISLRENHYKINNRMLAVEVRFKKNNASNENKFNKIFDDWYNWSIKLGNAKSVQQIKSTGKSIIIKIDFNKEIENSLAALMVLLTDTKHRTTIDYMDMDFEGHIGDVMSRG